jgi:hypothetical protein
VTGLQLIGGIHPRDDQTLVYLGPAPQTRQGLLRNTLPMHREQCLGQRDGNGQPAKAPRNAGAGFVVVYTGEIMTMPGLPHQPAAMSIDIDESDNISGLF